MTGFTLSASDDNETYTDVASVSGLSGGTTDGKLEAPASGRYFKFVPAASAEAVAGDHLAAFPDAGSVKAFARASMNWAIANGILCGVEKNGETNLLPADTASRAQFAAIITRYLEAM